MALNHLMPIPKATLTPSIPIAYGATVVIMVIAFVPMFAAADWIAFVKLVMSGLNVADLFFPPLYYFFISLNICIVRCTI